MKNQGNDALKAGKLDEAVDFYTQSLDVERTEGVLTNRAQAYIKLKKFKEALADSETALLLNANFAKAHIRAYTCYIQIGEFQKAEKALHSAVKLGDESARANFVTVAEFLRYEEYALKAFNEKKWSEAKYLYKNILAKSTDSVKHTCLLLETMVRESPNDFTDTISFTTKIQNNFIEYPEFLFWRGRILMYNG